MDIDDFRLLNEEEKVELVNERLKELKENNKTIKDFKYKDLDFTYVMALKELQELGYAKCGDEFKKEVKLTEDEVIKLKNLCSGYEFVMKRINDQPKIHRRPGDGISTTSVRVYNKVWERWKAFTSDWSIYNSVDLMATALEKYMDTYDFEDYETLLKQGKVKEV